ncbi:hypothetical protein [Shewanella sp.]|uniref:hypothetical protein n=1 Tax=Shewanella sp. TaxID=50422 RepID=UPI004048690E
MKTSSIMTLAICLFIIAPYGLAQDESLSTQNCHLTVNPPKPVLKSLYDVSLTFAINTCKAMAEDDVRAIKDITFLTGGLREGARQEVINLFTTSFPESNFPTVKDAKFMWAEYQFPDMLQMDSYELTLAYTAGRRYGFSGPRLSKLPEIEHSDVIRDHCVSLGYKSCKSLFNDIERVGRIQNHFIRKDYSDAALAGIRKKSAAWDIFSDSSRFQTPVDILFTSWIYRKELSDGKNLNFPPENQYFLLHPSLVIDHFSEAKVGNKDEFSLALEWAGFNRWEEKIPWGVSLASVYTDRDDGKSVGHGLMFHIYNNFSFGFANRGNGDNSFYINIEFMDWFGEKQEKYKSYKKKLSF